MLLAQFNKLSSVGLVLSAVVLSTIGVFIGLIIMGQSFGVVMTGIGIIALAGIVTNNNIVLIDTYDRLRSEGVPVEEAILQTCRERARPVLLTAVTAVLGVLPIAFGLNIDFLNREVTYGAPSTQWWIQLSTAIVFGLSFATVLTLIVTPASAFRPRQAPPRLGPVPRAALGEAGAAARSTTTGDRRRSAGRAGRSESAGSLPGELWRALPSPGQARTAPRHSYSAAAGTGEPRRSPPASARRSPAQLPPQPSRGRAACSSVEPRLGEAGEQLYTTGVRNSVATVAKPSPPTMIQPSAWRASEPAPLRSSSGRPPSTVATMVITTGRRRISAALRMASRTDWPASRSWLANSTIRMPFFDIRPTSMTRPISL